MRSWFLVFGIILFPGMAFASKEVGNGGDSYSMEFAVAADQVYWFLKEKPVAGIDMYRLGLAIFQTRIESTDKGLFINHVPKDAINYPRELRILFNQDRWSKLNDSERAGLVLHEFLGILEVDDTGYRLSKLALRNLKYENSAIVLNDKLAVNEDAGNHYALDVRVTVESYGPQISKYNAGLENIRVTIENSSFKRVFPLKLKGHALFACIDGNRLFLRVLMPVTGEDGKPLRRQSDEDYSSYVEHEARDYLVHFKRPASSSGPPEAIEAQGPLPNLGPTVWPYFNCLR